MILTMMTRMERPFTIFLSMMVPISISRFPALARRRHATTRYRRRRRRRHFRGRTNGKRHHHHHHHRDDFVVLFGVYYSHAYIKLCFFFEDFGKRFISVVSRLFCVERRPRRPKSIILLFFWIFFYWMMTQ